MKKSLMMDILACPMDKDFPLELFEVNTKHDRDDVVDGALFCKKCGRFYLVVEEIPIMLPDDLRNKQKEIDILTKWRDKLPDKITRKGNPWHL